MDHLRDRPDHDQEETDAEVPLWLLPGLATGGAVLAAGLHAAITRGRARQARLRAPGRMVAPVPDELTPVVVTARAAGQPRVPDLERLNLLLRDLVERLDGAPRPSLVAVELGATDVVLHLAEPAALPEPWTGEGVRWTAPVDAAPERSDVQSPYPMLAAVGHDDAGHTWLLDVEHLRTATVIGDDDAVAAFVRYVVAELALNPWTTDLTTHAVGVAPGAAGLSRYRVQEHDDNGFLEPIIRAVKTGPAAEEYDELHLVVTARDVPGLREAIRSRPGRSPAALLQVGGDPAECDVVVVVEDGRLRIDALDVDLAAAHMSVQELEASVKIVAITRNPADAPNPLVEAATGRTAVDGEPVVMAAERPADVSIPAGPGSLLPASDVEYLAATANTREDLARLAPVVSEPTVVGEAGGQPEPDETLEQDLADWHDPSCERPRVEVLGKVMMRGCVRPIPEVVKERWGLFVALAAYLALHPKGVTLTQCADAFHQFENDMRPRLSNLRRYFGHLPDGSARPTAGRGGRRRKDGTTPIHRYRVEGMLCDADLLRRLHARAVRRGEAGLADLVTALELVRGRPFIWPEKQDNHWHWADHGEHLVAQYTGLVGDIAHLVITLALRDGNLTLGRQACETWRDVDPVSEALANDDALLLVAEGHPEQAKAVADELWTRVDDEVAPTEPGARSMRVTSSPMRSLDCHPRDSAI